MPERVDLHGLLLSGDVKRLLAAMVRAERAEAQGEYCRCGPDDVDVGARAGEPFDSMSKETLCFSCGLTNLERKESVEAAMAAPHLFVPMGDRLVLSIFCRFCTMNRADPRHEGLGGGPSFQSVGKIARQAAENATEDAMKSTARKGRTRATRRQQ
jgi:hypothetical protein